MTRFDMVQHTLLFFCRMNLNWEHIHRTNESCNPISVRKNSGKWLCKINALVRISATNILLFIQNKSAFFSFLHCSDRNDIYSLGIATLLYRDKFIKEICIRYTRTYRKMPVFVFFRASWSLYGRCTCLIQVL